MYFALLWEVKLDKSVNLARSLNKEKVKQIDKGKTTVLQLSRIISMAGYSLENSYAERLNGINKNDYLRYFDTSMFSQLSKTLDRVFWLYNNEKPHSELGYMTPVNFEKN